MGKLRNKSTFGEKGTGGNEAIYFRGSKEQREASEIDYIYHISRSLFSETKFEDQEINLVSPKNEPVKDYNTSHIFNRTETSTDLLFAGPNLIYLGSMNPEYTAFSSDPETCYYIFLLSRSYLSTENFHDV